MKGLSLVEFLISVLVLSVLLAGAYMILSISDKSNFSENGYLDLQQNARQAMYAMVRELRGANSVVASGNTVTFNTLTTADVRYYLCSGNILKRCLAENCCSNQNGSYLGNSINYLNFALSGNVLEINLTAQKTVRGRTLCFPSPCADPATVLKEKVRLRNE
jgi:prepilin-type N-terminal cleavage/methylation domain-containing protein